MSINFDQTETYDDPKLGGSFLFSDIGHAKYIQAWEAGSANEDCEVEGVSYSKGFRVYVAAKKGESAEATKTRAKEIREKHTNGKYLNRVCLFTMPVASVTNRSADSKAQAKVQINQGAARVSAINPKVDLCTDGNKNSLAINLITIPSLVDAYARHKGWYTEALWDHQAVSGIGGSKNNDAKEDAAYCIPTLVEMRKAIWAALGEKDWMKLETDAPKLKEALSLYRNPWDGWVELANVPDPHPKAFYTGNKEVEDDNGVKRIPKKRQTTPAVLNFYEGEKQAQVEGERRIAEREGGEAKAGSALKVAFDKLSGTAKAVYTDEASWRSSEPEILEALKKAGKLTPPQTKKFADEYALAVDDVKLLAA